MGDNPRLFAKDGFHLLDASERGVGELHQESMLRCIHRE
jgi:hypothetical protein